MSGEMVRYNRDQQGLTKVSEARRKMDEALATLRGETSLVIEAEREWRHQIISPRSSQTGAGAVLDMPRVCAVHDRLYVSRYVQAADGFFHYGQGIRITTKSSDQYSSDRQDQGSLQPSDLEDETCPWCGSAGFGAILCIYCNAEVCRGRTISNTMFHCRESCGHSGRLDNKPRPLRGLRPQLGSGSSPFAGG